MGRDAEVFLGAGFWVCSDSFTVLFQRLCSKCPYLCPHETTGATNCRTAHGGRRPANLGFSEGFASVDSRHKELGVKRLRGDSPQRRTDAGESAGICGDGHGTARKPATFVLPP